MLQQNDFQNFFFLPHIRNHINFLLIVAEYTPGKL